MLVCTDTECRLDGEISVETAAALLNELKPRIASHVPTLDFSGVTHVDSSVVALMLSCQREAAQHQYRLHFSGLSQNISTLADLYGVDFLFKA